MSRPSFDGGGFPLFRSYHDVRLPPNLVGRHVSDDVQVRYAFKDFVKALRDDPNWRRWFTASQVVAIEHAMRANNPRIPGFRWHHHQDHGVMQLVLESDHRVYHFGGRFTTGGRPR
jgi:filamentous hemagglutinin